MPHTVRYAMVGGKRIDNSVERQRVVINGCGGAYELACSMPCHAPQSLLCNVGALGRDDHLWVNTLFLFVGLCPILGILSYLVNLLCQLIQGVQTHMTCPYSS